MKMTTTELKEITKLMDFLENNVGELVLVDVSLSDSADYPIGKITWDAEYSCNVFIPAGTDE